VQVQLRESLCSLARIRIGPILLHLAATYWVHQPKLSWAVYIPKAKAELQDMGS
jgi:hypothetical protein